jgi:hypothetical protein
MPRRHAPLVSKAVVALAKKGFDADVDLAGRHVKIRCLKNGCLHFLVVPRTPSDRRAAANSRAVLRRLVQDGEARS